MRVALSIATWTIALVACGAGDRARDADSTPPGADTSHVSASTDPAAGPTVSAPMRDITGRDLGTLTLAESAGGITVAGTLRGLSPGLHAIHLHTTGRCEPPFRSAGGHWNPTSRQHGTRNPQGPHVGDLPNVMAGRDSVADVQVTTPGGTLRGENALLDGDGATVIVHAGADDYRTESSGNSGRRIACGVVSGS
jgi:Cu-Zn family superoxide dismutase